MKISVFGTGYVGLVAAVCFADKGNDVICVDLDSQKIEKLKQGIVPIYEPGLTDLLVKNKERLSFTTDTKQAITGSQVIFIAVGTPQRKDSFEADTSAVEAVAQAVAENADNDKILVIKSTVPLGTAERVKAVVSKSSHTISVVSNPEFQKEGDAVRDFETPDRVVIGTADEHSRNVLRELYEPFFRRSERVLFMNNASAELTKYGANTMLAARISLMNELSRVAEAAGADIMDVMKGIGTDNRIGSAFLFPSPGYGGSCFPKDVRELIATTQRLGVTTSLIPAIEHTNEMQKEHFASMALANIKGKRVAVWGVTYKPKTDDTRGSAAIVVIERLLAAGLQVALFDPEGMEKARKHFADRIEYLDQYKVLENADALVIMTDWNDFKNPDFGRIKQLLSQPLIIDSRNLYHPQKVREEGFTYLSLGRA